MGKKKNNIPDDDKKQKRLFKKTRGGIVLTESQVQEIKEGRKQLRKQMKKQGIRSKKEFELTASSMGLYFDKSRKFGLLLWLFHGRALWALLGALIALLLAMFLFSLVSQMRGHFTISLSDDMFKNGFELSDEPTFATPASQLFSDPAEGIPCVSISDIPVEVDSIDGPHNGPAYFAYTFYLRNVGEDTVDYSYSLDVNSESQFLSDATWVMLFQDGKMTFYAKDGMDGRPEAIPDYTDNTRGYRDLPLMGQTASPQEQYQLVGSTSLGDFYRILPVSWESEKLVTSGTRYQIAPYEVHKYTVVLWLEGDDPECTDEKIGGHLGMEMNFQLLENEEEDESFWDKIFSGMKFWEA